MSSSSNCKEEGLSTDKSVPEEEDDVNVSNKSNSESESAIIIKDVLSSSSSSLEEFEHSEAEVPADDLQVEVKCEPEEEEEEVPKEGKRTVRKRRKSSSKNPDFEYFEPGQSTNDDDLKSSSGGSSKMRSRSANKKSKQDDPEVPEEGKTLQKRRKSSSKNPDFEYFETSKSDSSKDDPKSSSGSGSKTRSKSATAKKSKQDDPGDDEEYFLAGKKLQIVLDKIDIDKLIVPSKTRKSTATTSKKTVKNGKDKAAVVVAPTIEYPEFDTNDEEESFLLEVCVDNHLSIVNAGKGGAKRIELCSSLSEGGLTPTPGLLRMAKATLKIPVFVMIRPRGGDFVYSYNEIEIMSMNIVHYKELGADGFVFGVLDKNGRIDEEKNKVLLQAADPLPCTFHRAFDVCQGRPFGALESIIKLGFTRILTSGQQPSAEQGIPFIRQLVRAAGNSISIMAGAGVNANNVAKIIKETGVKEVHGSARVKVESQMKRTKGNKSEVSMGTPGTDDSCYYATDIKIVTEIVKNASNATE